MFGECFLSGVARILAVMGSWAPVVPGWIVPLGSQVVDLMWLSYATWVDARSPWAGGVMSTAAWVRGGRQAPVTGRAESPVTRELAQAELWATLVVATAGPGMPAFPAESLCAPLSVSYVPPTPVDRKWAQGVASTLRWLLGTRSAAGTVAAAPLPLPVRRADGSIPTAEELYASMVAAACVPMLPEQRQELRSRVVLDVARSHRLDAEIQSVQRELATRA